PVGGGDRGAPGGWPARVPRAQPVPDGPCEPGADAHLVESFGGRCEQGRSLGDRQGAGWHGRSRLPGRSEADLGRCRAAGADRPALSRHAEEAASADVDRPESLRGPGHAEGDRRQEDQGKPDEVAGDRPACHQAMKHEAPGTAMFRGLRHGQRLAQTWTASFGGVVRANAHGRRYLIRDTMRITARMIAPPSVIADGRIPGMPYRSSDASHTSDGIATNPNAWVTLTTRATQNTQLHPLKERMPIALPTI